MEVSRSSRETRASAFRWSAPGALGRQQKENQIDGLLIDSVKLHRSLKTGEDAIEAFEIGEFAVRDGDAAAYAGRAEALALEQGFEDLAVVHAGDACGALGEFLKQLLLVGRLQIRDNGFRL